jgi:3-hydroxybutyryl-CoA dehydrogenase
MGPFRLLDIVGLDIHQQVATRLYEQLREPRFFPPPMVERMVAAGDLGRKTGRGFYTYDDTRLFGS